MDDSQVDASGHEDAPDDGIEEAPEASSGNLQTTIRRAVSNLLLLLNVLATIG